MRSRDRALTTSERAAMGATAGDKARVGQSVDMAPESAPESILRVSGGNVEKLMLYATAHDRQPRGKVESTVWLEHIEGMPYDEAKEAIRDYYQQTRWPITPGDIRHMVEEGVPLP